VTGARKIGSMVVGCAVAALADAGLGDRGGQEPIASILDHVIHAPSTRPNDRFSIEPGLQVEYAKGIGWKVWVGLPGNPEVQQAPLNEGLPIPQYREAKEIAVNDNLLN